MLSLRHVTQQFDSSTVLHDISVDIAPGEVLAIVGENGAGKSTLMKIITGVLRPTQGEVRVGLDDRPIESVRQARQAGVILIPQELAYMPEQSVANNLSLGRWPSRFGFIDARKAASIARETLAQLGGPSDVRQPMSALTLGEQQLVEIGKALAMPNIQLLCFDEPTAALNSVESRRLLDVILALKKQGTAAIYVSHRLDELRVIADKILVLRNGYQVGLVDAPGADPALIASLMLGREHTGRGERNLADRADSAAERDSLRLVDWTYEGQPRLVGASLKAVRGEILGVYGLAGSGVESLARGLGGLLPARLTKGASSVFGRGRGVFRSPLEARRNGIVYLPADRKHDGLMLSQSVRDNLSLPSLGSVSRWGFMSRSRERRRSAKLVADYSVRTTGLTQPVGSLSGGNQQKILFANRAVGNPSVLVLHEPTRGVDVGARGDIHDQIRRARDEGTCVILITTDIEEVVDVADRVAVMRYGEVVAELVGNEITDDSVLTWAATDRKAEK